MTENKYSWITDDMFDAKLVQIARLMGAEQILAIPGVYEIVREELNNEVLQTLEEERSLEEIKCEIMWIDSNAGTPTPDDNPAICYVRCLGYPLRDNAAYAINPAYKPETSRWFACCADHRAQMPTDGYWESKPLDETEQA